MPSRRKLNPEKILELLLTTCPQCAAKIPPEERKHVDTEHLECPKCGKQFIHR
ncbi:MAG: hypothetical protein JO159_13715 [Acidobacteria bacterium]|nr:hypothetical protein [Acidobacteriota bacterium]